MQWVTIEVGADKKLVVGEHACTTDLVRAVTVIRSATFIRHAIAEADNY